MKFKTCTIKTLLLITLIMLIGCKTKKTTLLGSSGEWPSNDVPGKWSEAHLPLNVQFSSDFSDDELIEVTRMAKNWNDSHDEWSFFIMPPSSTPNINPANIVEYNDGILGVYKSYKWFSNVSSDALAVTQYFGRMINQGTPGEYLELSHADVIVNYKNFNFSIKPNFGAYDLPSVILHELGHVLGLKHENDYSIDSVMQPSILSQVMERELYVADEIAINDNYNSLSTTSSKNSMQERNVGESVRGIIELHSNGSCRHHSLKIH